MEALEQSLVVALAKPRSVVVHTHAHALIGRVDVHLHSPAVTRVTRGVIEQHRHEFV